MTRILLLAAALGLAAQAAGAAVTGSIWIDSPSASVRSNPTAIGFGRRGINGPDDLGIDQGYVGASLASGKMNFLARDGLQTGTSSTVNGVSVRAEMGDTLTFIPNRPGVAEVMTLAFVVHAESTLLVDTFPTFGYPSATQGGQADLATLFSLVVREQSPGNPNVNTTVTRVTHDVDGAWTRNTGSGPDYLITAANSNLTKDTVPPVNFLPTRVVDSRVTVGAANEARMRAVLEIDFLIDQPYTFDFEAVAAGSASGSLGFYSAVDALNTGAMAVRAPSGGTFTSASGVFLTQTGGPVAAVPLPASGMVLAGAVGLLWGARLVSRRRRI